MKKINLSITLTTLLTTGMVFGIISYILGDSGGICYQHYGMQHVEKLVHLHETFALTSLITYGFATSTQIGSMWFIKYKNYVQVRQLY